MREMKLPSAAGINVTLAIVSVPCCVFRILVIPLDQLTMSVNTKRLEWYKWIMVVCPADSWRQQER